jgi:2-oxoglutarate ferredoxin oxidoreductase subunit gamma
MAKVRVRLSGSGGQGLLLAGLMLAEAASIYDCKYVSQTQSYGPEARGGASRSDIIISDQPIIFPKPDKVDVLLALNQASVDRFYSSLGENGIFLIDDSLVETLPTQTAYRIPFTALAYENFKTRIVTNVIALGALNELANLVKVAALRKAVSKRVPPAHRSTNMKALDIGIAEGRKIQKIGTFEHMEEWEL